MLRAARELFTTRGYAGTSVADIARAAGVSIDTLYETVGRKPHHTVADLVWSMNAPEYFLLITSRGRTAEQYAAMVRDVWIQTLLRNPPR